MTTTTDRPSDGERSRVFGEAAEQYDAARPGYATELVDEVLAYARLAGRPALEVGAGTGKATVPFAERGVPVLCVEPDDRMAAVLRRNTAPYPGVQVEVADFNEWQPGERRFGLLFAATSWHWLTPGRRFELAHAALEPGGAIALFWNPQGIIDPALHAELAEIDRRYGVDGSPHAQLGSTYGEVPGSRGGAEGWPAEECAADGRFTDFRASRHWQEVRYGTERYLAFLSSISAYRILSEENRAGALADTARVLDREGGGIDMCHLSDLFLARTR
ncbi:SAM-dependent methyltransferase [Kitasatospora sp. MMS16-BH015]|uniref:class I SAM-dependent methyltransferase n=1 Tax=Kitasatospora sp. MMS16-BH015 TaxID=2018025 RepID=UPI000CA38766|nr:class I SAM-dependent methyltransferase [Kitasatospora sp. MMS16-BH015]AUG75197.1 SAM-dependent methyltransferase [Kitasatospora sp. MMS16-BH015]